MKKTVLLLALSACAAPRASTVADLDPADHLRAEISRADVVKRLALLDELAKVELRRAQAAHTAAAYRHFLAEFPGGEEATAARALLEGLEFDRAGMLDTQVAWTAFLDEFPRGRRVSEARARLASLVAAEAMRSEDPALVRRAIDRFPESPERSALLAREETLAWQRVNRADAESVQAFLVAHPSTSLRGEAQAVLQTFERQRILETFDVDRARARAEAKNATEADRSLLAELEWRSARARFDEAAIAKVAAGTGPFSAEARAMVDSLRKSPLSPTLRAAVDAARASSGLPEAGAIEQELRSEDALVRARAIGLLSELGHPSDLERLWAACDGRYLVVRLAALSALQERASALSAGAWKSFASERERELLPRAFSAVPWRKVAALRDAGGDRDGAAAAWAEVLRSDPDDLVARFRLWSRQREQGDLLAVGASARELMRSAIAFADGRWLSPPDPSIAPEANPEGKGRVLGLRPERSLLRQMCAALDLAEAGARSLREVQLAATASEGELLGLALADGEAAIARLRARQRELESAERRENASFMACDRAVLDERVAAARERRVVAIELLGASGDARLEPFVRALATSPSMKVRQAATAAADRLTGR